MAGRWTQAKLASSIQGYMDRVASRIEAQPTKAKLAMEHQLLGMKNLAKQLGVDCDCFFTEWMQTPRTVCRCKPAKTARKRRARSLTGSFAGTGCRDKEGAFVPVPQCRRRRLTKE